MTIFEKMTKEQLVKECISYKSRCDEILTRNYKLSENFLVMKEQAETNKMAVSIEIEKNQALEKRIEKLESLRNGAESLLRIIKATVNSSYYEGEDTRKING